jgi:alpha-glucan,water dikinase
LLLQRHAEALGQRAKVDKAYIMNFGEEVVRGQPVFVLSGLLQDLERHLREAAGAGPWQVTKDILYRDSV